MQSIWMAWNLRYWCILTTLRTDKILVIIGWFPLFWCHFDLVKQAKLATSGHFLEKAREEWPEIWHADLSWPASEFIRFWSRSVYFPHFGIILTNWNRPNLVFLVLFFRMHMRNIFKFYMLIYSDHLFNCLHFGHGLSRFSSIRDIFYFVKKVKFAFSRHFLGNACE